MQENTHADELTRGEELRLKLSFSVNTSFANHTCDNIHGSVGRPAVQNLWRGFVGNFFSCSRSSKWSISSVDFRKPISYVNSCDGLPRS